MHGGRQLTFLGTGTSVGVPMIGCECAVCTSANPRNSRYRSSVLVSLPAGNILIDTTPELRLQLVRERLSRIDAVLYTHYHVDHLYGMDDLRIVAKYIEGPVPLYCTEEVEEVIRRVFSYAYGNVLPSGFVPQTAFRRIGTEPFTVLGQVVEPIPVEHSIFEVQAFRFDDLIYCTDVSRIPDASFARMRGVRTLILDCLRYQSHPAHLGLSDALAIIAELKPERAYLTHMSHELDYEVLNDRLPEGVEMAYDGLKLDF